MARCGRSILIWALGGFALTHSGILAVSAVRFSVARCPALARDVAAHRWQHNLTGATLYAPEQLRCNAWGQVFTAPEPEGVGPEKFDEMAMAMIAVLKYDSGMPFHRIENLETRLGVPLPAATQWEIVEEAAVLPQPVSDELIRQRTKPTHRERYVEINVGGSELNL